MGKNLIFTTHIRTKYMTAESLGAYQLCADTQRRYASRIGADFICQEEPELNLGEYGNAEKLNWTKHLDNYDRVLSLDADVFIKPNAPNIFDALNNDSVVYALDESRYNITIVLDSMVPDICNKRPDLADTIKRVVEKHKTIGYYNVGVVLVSKPQQELFRVDDTYPDPPYWRADQDFFNCKLWEKFRDSDHISNYVQHLPIAYNGMLVYDPHAEQNCHFVHYAGGHVLEAYHDYSVYYPDSKLQVPARYALPRRMRANEGARVGLRSLISVLPNNAVGVEINAETGEGTEILAETCEKLWAVDKWGNSDTENEFDVRVQHLQQVKKVKTPVELAVEAVPGAFDFVYINNTDMPGDVKRYIDMWLPRIKGKGCICGHNYHIQHVRDDVTSAFGEMDGDILQCFCDNSWLYHKQTS